jgi:myo-inositol-1(or 4)-monophosphatase
MFRTLFAPAAGIRRAGAAALDLAYVAAGRLDGFWEIGLSEWDTAAGALLVLEAGGMVSDFAGGGDYLETGNVVCAGPRLHAAMVAAIAPHRGEALQR